MDWKELLGEGDSFTIEQIEKAVSGMKLTDLSEGGYVSKDKFDKREKTAKDRIEELEGELKELKDAGEGDEALKARIKTLEADLKTAKSETEKAEEDAKEKSKALTSKEHESAIAKKAGHLNEKMQRLVLEDAEKLVSDTVEFDAALAKVLKDDPDYAEADTNQPKVGTGPAANEGVDHKDPLIAAIDKALPDREAAKDKE